MDKIYYIILVALMFFFSFQGLPRQFSKAGEIGDWCATVIFVSSVGHASYNFPQYDEYAFPPSYSSLLLGPPPTDKVTSLD